MNPRAVRLAAKVVFAICMATAETWVANAAAVPAFELDRGGVLNVVALPEVLSRREVRPHLISGLTTSFLVEVEARDARGQDVHGMGRIDVRYELWDEVYLVRVFGAGSAQRLPPVRSFEELQMVWQRLRLPITATGPLDRRGGPWKIEVTLSVVPFSQSEQRDAQRWFNDSIAVRPPTSVETPGVRPRDSATGGDDNGVLDLFLGSSIQRRSLVHYDWTVEFRPEPGR
ncbi:MAG TPA: hypothetical protein VN851_02990 [Thermoanaerobaculia bacterium]|nr:hypothetical protein [Thermoanaerobaculia bacterium]